MKVIHHHNVGAKMTACGKLFDKVESSYKWQSVTCKTCLKEKRFLELSAEFNKSKGGR